MIAMCVDGPLAEEVVELRDDALPEYEDELSRHRIEFPIPATFRAAAAVDAFEPVVMRAQYRLVEHWWDPEASSWFGRMEFVR